MFYQIGQLTGRISHQIAKAGISSTIDLANGRVARQVWKDHTESYMAQANEALPVILQNNTAKISQEVKARVGAFDMSQYLI